MLNFNQPEPVEPRALICHDCKVIAFVFKRDAILSVRCESCQKRRDEYYNDKLASDHAGGRKSRLSYHEHSTYHPHNGKA